MNSFLIEKAMNSDAILKRAFGGVYMLDELPRVPAFQRPKAFIFNTSTLPGEHWVCAFFPLTGPAEYFDPAGQKPRLEFVYFLNKHSRKWRRNVEPFQPPESWTCGQFCIFYLSLRICNKDPYDFLSNKTLHLNDFFVDAFVTRSFKLNRKYCIH
ncbi:uncharacterized protein LOC131936908 [Physella acuta]|uniref:uncharacterized protein LOC131936908 n=1 Tax=Physella acuta TaxID=109671 RepID=UPI0027DBE6C0|nr:uncharacterized protein LOC131936908 [Physella acuta]